MTNPPKYALTFLRWFCREDCIDEIEGDLMEVFEKDIGHSRGKAQRKFVWSVFRHFRPEFIKAFRSDRKQNNLDMYRNYFKIGLRTLVSNKWYTAINVAGLALGLASSILIFLFVRHHLQFDNFHNDPDRVYRLVTEEHTDHIDYSASVPPGFANALKADYSGVEKVAKVVTWGNRLITVDKARKFQEEVAFAEPEFFDILNFPLANGAQPDLSRPNTAVISTWMAKKLFGDRDPLGESFQLEGKELIVVIGVMKDIPTTTLIKSNIFISFSTLKPYNDFLAGESWGGISTSLQCFARLHPAQDAGEIERSLSGYSRKFRPTAKNVHHYKLQPLSAIHFDPRYSGGINPELLWIFSFIGIFLIAIASINFINIATAQSATRSKEVGVRKLLGSPKKYLFWQFMTEAFAVTVLAFLLAILIAVMVLPYFNVLFDLQLLIGDVLTFDFVAFALLLMVTIVFMSGSYPGLLLANAAPLMALKGKLAAKNADGLMIRKTLVVVQFTISIVLVIGTVGVNKQIGYATQSDLGFDRSGIVMVPLPTTLTKTQIKSLNDRINQIPGVEKVSVCFAPPGAGANDWGTSVKFDNRPEAEEFSIQAKMADTGYLETFGLKLVAGRNFYAKDSVDEVLVNASFARKVGLNSPEELLGKTLDISHGYFKATIVGVVNDFHDLDFHQAVSPIFIAPLQESYNDVAVKIDMSNRHNVLEGIEKQWTTFYPDRLFEYSLLDDRVNNLYKSEKQFLSLTRLFSIIAIFIGALGIYGLIVFVVAQKTKEIGVRKVLGGSIADILLLLSKDFLVLIVAGSAIASPVAWYLVHTWLEGYTYKTEISGWVFIFATGLITVITLLTISYHAVRAAIANPVNSLRSE